MYRTKDGVSDGRTAKFLPKYVVASKQQYAQQQAEKHKQANASNSEDGAPVNPLSPKSRKFLTEENIGGGKTGGDISTIEIKAILLGNARKKTFFFQEVFPKIVL